MEAGMLTFSVEIVLTLNDLEPLKAKRPLKTKLKTTLREEMMKELERLKAIMRGGSEKEVKMELSGQDTLNYIDALSTLTKDNYKLRKFNDDFYRSLDKKFQSMDKAE